MKTPNRVTMAFALAALSLVSAASAEARTCKRLTKTGGAAVGAVAGGGQPAQF